MRIRFQHLPPEVRDQLGAITRGEPAGSDVLVIPQDRFFAGALFLAIGLAILGGFGYLGVICESWGVVEWIVFGLLLLAGVAVIRVSILRLRRAAQSLVRPAIVVTPRLMIEVEFMDTDVRIHRMEDLRDQAMMHVTRNMYYDRTEFSYRFEDGEINFTLPSRTQAEEVAERIRALAGSSGRSPSALDEWLAKIQGGGPGGPSSAGRRKWRGLAISALIALPLTALLGLGNRFVGEPLDWSAATKENTPSAYEKYMRKRRTGSHLAEAIKRRDDLIFAEAVKKGDKESYRAYLRLLPTGLHAREARAAILELGGTP